MMVKHNQSIIFIIHRAMTEILEHIPLKIFSDEGNGIAEEVAKIIAQEIEAKNAAGKTAVIGMCMGNTALDVYRELIALYEKKKIDFQNVISFNLEEYYELRHDHICSTHRFMAENFFDHINIKKENIHIPDGMVPKDKIPAYCKEYEEQIKKAGGIDILVTGIGGDGHIGFNDPATSYDSRTRLVELDESLKLDGVPDFGDVKHVPKSAITLGIGTIREAKRIILLATGDHKAQIIREAVEGKVMSKINATYFQDHKNVMLYLDQAAASKLTRCLTPWLVGDVDWSQQINRARAVTHLAEFLKKEITQLETRDFLQYSLRDLITKYPTEKLVDEMYKLIQSKIKRTEDLPHHQRVLVFSPHPDDDIISMGGTLMKLVKNKNIVHCIYMTPGYNAVFDHDVEKFWMARKFYDQVYGLKEQEETDTKMLKQAQDFIKEKEESKFGRTDIENFKKVKKIIRQAEGASTCSYVEVEGYEYMSPLFYESGRAKKNPLTKTDVDLIWDILQKYKPTIVYAAGDLTDPNGTHRLCLRGIIQAFQRYTKDAPELWLYRGAWQEFHPADADIFVTMTPTELAAKREGIFRHQSQKDRPPQPGHSNKEFWQRAEERNIGTAKLLESYGYKGLYALEGLMKYKG